MARRLAQSVVVRETQPFNPDHPELGVTILREEILPAGSDVPDWAKDLIGDHIPFEDDDEPEAIEPPADDESEDEPDDGSEDASGDPADGSDSEGDSEDDESEDDDEPDEGPVERPSIDALRSEPAGNAKLEAWQDYAKATGASEGDIEGMSRNELRELYGSKSD